MENFDLLDRKKRYYEILKRPKGIKAKIELLSRRLELKKSPEDREELIQRIDAQKAALEEAKNDVLDLIDHIPRIDDYRVARLRYIDCMHDSDIAYTIEKSPSFVRNCSTPRLIATILANQVFTP